MSHGDGIERDCCLPNGLNVFFTKLRLWHSRLLKYFLRPKIFACLNLFIYRQASLNHSHTVLKSLSVDFEQVSMGRYRALDHHVVNGQRTDLGK